MSEDASASEVARLAAGAIRGAALTGVGAVHGLVGDSLHRAAPIVTTRMELRAAGRRVRATRSGLAGAFPSARPTLLVLVHGLFETEAVWSFAGIGRHGVRTAPTYGDALADELGSTALMVRYNTGLRVSDNGAALLELLGTVVRRWPVEVGRIVLVGHSMGGLVIHSALAQVPDVPVDELPDELAWTRLVTDTVSLGAPHHGAPLERAVASAAAALDRGRSTRWAAAVLRARSVGIKDMRHGNLLEADWSGHDPDHPADTRSPGRPRGRVRHRAVVGSLTRGDHPVGRTIGDLVVPVASARHESPEESLSRFAAEDVAVVAPLHHLTLVNDDRVLEVLRSWLLPPTD